MGAGRDGEVGKHHKIGDKSSVRNESNVYILVSIRRAGCSAIYKLGYLGKVSKLLCATASSPQK